MTRVVQVVKSILLIIANPKLLGLIWRSNSRYQQEVKKRYPKYFAGLSVLPLSHFVIGDITIPTYSFLPGTSDVSDLVLLASIAKSKDSCRYLELGTFRGESLLLVQHYATKCTAITLSKKLLYEKHFPKQEIEANLLFENYFQGHTNIIQRDTSDFDFNRLEKYDLTFIDADHRFEAIVRDTQKILESCLSDDGVVVWHDYLLNDRSVNFEVMSAILTAVPVALHPHLYHVQGTKCALLLPEKVENIRSLHSFIPDQSYSLTVSKLEKGNH